MIHIKNWRFYVLNFIPPLSCYAFFLLCSNVCFLSLCLFPYHPFRPCLFCSSAYFQYTVSLTNFSFFVAVFLPFPLALLFCIPCSPFVLSISPPSVFTSSLLSPIRCRSLTNSARACTGHKHELRSSPRAHVCCSQGPFPHSLLSSLTVDRASTSYKFPVCLE